MNLGWLVGNRLLVFVDEDIIGWVVPLPIRRFLGVPKVVYEYKEKSPGRFRRIWSFFYWALSVLGVCLAFEFFFPWESISKTKKLAFTMKEWKNFLVLSSE